MGHDAAMVTGLSLAHQRATGRLTCPSANAGSGRQMVPLMSGAPAGSADPSQGDSMVTSSVSQSARYVAGTTISRASENGGIRTFPKVENVGIPPFHRGATPYFETLNLNSTMSPSCIT